MAPGAKTTWQCRANRVLVENARFATAAVSRALKKRPNHVDLNPISYVSHQGLFQLI